MAAIFAVFTSSENENHEPLARSDGVLEFELAPPVDHPAAAAYAATAAGHLAVLEQDGHVKIARRIGDVDAARESDGPPAAILHLEGAEAIDPGLEALDFWYAAGLRSLGPVWSRSNSFGHGVPFIFPSSPDTGPGLTDAGRALVRRCAELGILRRPQPPQRGGVLGCREDRARAARREPLGRARAVRRVAQSDRRAARRDRREPVASSGLCSRVRSYVADFSEDTDTPIALIAEHARYVADRIGVEHVALGSDFDGAPIPDELGDAAGMPKLLGELENAGFTADEIDAIAWRNWRRVLAHWWK